MQITLNQNKNRFEVRCPYNPALVSILHSLSARWDRSAKVWHMGADVPSLQSLRLAFPYAEMGPEIKTWELGILRQADRNAAIKSNGADLSEFTFKSEPREHQLKILQLMLENPGFAVLAEMGTGKSACVVYAVDVLKRREGRCKTLIVAPLSVVYNWANEAVKHTDGLRVKLLVGSRWQREAALDEEADIYVINYAGIRIMREKLLETDWDMVVCDESQNIKNRTAIQSKVCCEVGAKAKRRYILTGTVMTNRPLDVFGQFKFIDTKILGANYFAFQNRYAIMATNGAMRFPVKYVNMEELSERIAPWSFRILKSECLDLPPKVYETRYAEMSEEASRIYKTLKLELAAEIKGGDIVTAPMILTKLLRFSQLTAGFVTTESGEVREVGGADKIKILLEVLDEIEGKAVVWVRFNKEREMVAEALRTRGIGFVSLSGEDKAEERQQSIRQFYDDVNCRVFVGQIEAGGTGINLTCASTCIYMSNSYSLGTRLQSEDRLHRIGQENKVTYIDIVCPGTIDEKVLGILREKKDVADILNQDKQAMLQLLGEEVPF